jgi:hypothetical protein
MKSVKHTTQSSKAPEAQWSVEVKNKSTPVADGGHKSSSSSPQSQRSTGSKK